MTPNGERSLLICWMWPHRRMGQLIGVAGWVDLCQNFSKRPFGCGPLGCRSISSRYRADMGSIWSAFTNCFVGVCVARYVVHVVACVIVCLPTAASTCISAHFQHCGDANNGPFTIRMMAKAMHGQSQQQHLSLPSVGIAHSVVRADCYYHVCCILVVGVFGLQWRLLT